MNAVVGLALLVREWMDRRFRRRRDRRADCRPAAVVKGSLHPPGAASRAPDVDRAGRPTDPVPDLEVNTAAGAIAGSAPVRSAFGAIREFHKRPADNEQPAGNGRDREQNHSENHPHHFPGQPAHADRQSANHETGHGESLAPASIHPAAAAASKPSSIADRPIAMSLPSEVIAFPPLVRAPGRARVEMAT